MQPYFELSNLIVLSARGQEDDKVRGLDAGADDYLGKPFGVAELAARIRGALRHLERGPAPHAAVFEAGGLRIDLAQGRVWREAEEIHLTPLQYRLLAALARHAGRVVTHRQLLREVWDGEGSAESVRVCVHQLRHKLEPDPVQPRWLRTEPGIGYRLAGD